MKYPHPYSQIRPAPLGAEGHALGRISLWIRLGLIGAIAVAIGLTSLINGDAPPSTGLTTILAGGVLAVFAWRRSWILLDGIDPGKEAVAAPVALGRLQAAAGIRSPG